MDPAMQSLVGPVGALNINFQQENRRLTLQERQEIARERYRNARQERKDYEDAFRAKISPKSQLPAECLPIATNPAIPPLWYGVPLSLDAFRDYIVKKDDPDNNDLSNIPIAMIPSVMRLLREACNNKRLYCINAMHPSTKELDWVIVFKCSTWPSATRPNHEADERIADAVRKEMDLPSDRQPLWHFNWNDADRVCKVIWDDLLDSDISDLELTA